MEEQDFKILIVDDDKNLSLNFKDIFDDKGYNTVAANDGETAIELCRLENFDLVLIDIKLPDIPGMKLVETITSISPDTEYIIITGYASLESAIEAVKGKNIVAYETKPINIKSILAYIVQVHERKYLEKALRETQKCYKELADSITDVFFAMDNNLKYIFWNKESEKFIGISQENAIGKSINDVFPDNEGTRNIAEICKRVIETRQSETFVNRFTLRAIEYFLEINVYPTQKGISVFIKDITERKKTEMLLLESEEKFRTIFESSIDGILISDVKTQKFSYPNPAICRMLGYTRKEMESMEVKDIHPKDKYDDVISDLDAQVRGEYTLAKDIPCLRKDGTVFFCDINASTFELFGDKKYIVGFFRDITERRQAQEALRQSYTNLEIQVQERTAELAETNQKLQNEIGERQKVIEKEKELNLIKNRFISVISHEFRTPLTGIQSTVQLIERYGDQWDAEKKQKFFNKIYSSIRFTNLLLDDVSIIGRDESGKISYNPSHCIIEEVCCRTFEDIKAVFGKSNIINFSIRPETIKTLADESLLRHILNNLLSNAVKYSGYEKQINFSAIADNDDIIFTITDNGIGIPEEDMKHIFEPFHRASNAELIKGTGLGLAIVKRCVGLHQGSIEIKSTLNKGTTAVVKIPYRKPEKK
jgi:PAS domain S-box-containing protein